MKPFKGFAERPYNQAILDSVDWYKIIPVELPLSEIWLTQKHLNIEGLLGKRYSMDDYGRIVRWEDEYYLEDGHHRTVMRVVIAHNAQLIYQWEWFRIYEAS